MGVIYLSVIKMFLLCAVLFALGFVYKSNSEKTSLMPEKTVISGNLYTYNFVFNSNSNEAVATGNNLKNYANAYHNYTSLGFNNNTILRIFIDIFAFSK